MSQPLPTLVLSVLLDEDLLVLNRAIGIVRRHNLAAASLAVGPGPRPGTRRLQLTLASEAAAVQRLANALRKVVGAREVSVLPEAACTAREHLLVRVRLGPPRLSALLDVLALYEATIVEEHAEELVIEATGPAPLLGSFLRALEPFGVLEEVRGGALALPLVPIATALRDALAAPPRAAAIPA